MIEREVDILIVGGGLIGATLLRALAGLGLNCLLVESKALTQQEHPDFDTRSLALSPASVRILSMLGIWQLLHEDATPIQLIHVSDQHRFGAARLHAQPDSPLGYVVEMHCISKALHAVVAPEQVLAPATLTHLDKDKSQATVQTNSGEYTIKARLIVAADGAESTVRSLSNAATQIKQYKQQAIVANIGLAKPHNFQAYERFTPDGPLALLPLQANKMSLVWAMAAEQATELLQAKDEVFLQKLQKAFGYRLGRLIKVGQRFSYPLQQVLMPRQVKWPIVFIGNAAHTLHPVAGQGFNLGLRDVAALAQCCAHYGINQDMLKYYLRLRYADQKNILSFTNGLINLFTSRIPGVGFARDLGLILLDNSAFLKKYLSRYAQGYSGILPDLVCDIALDNRGTHESSV